MGRFLHISKTWNPSTHTQQHCTHQHSHLNFHVKAHSLYGAFTDVQYFFELVCLSNFCELFSWKQSDCCQFCFDKTVCFTNQIFTPFSALQWWHLSYKCYPLLHFIFKFFKNISIALHNSQSVKREIAFWANPFPILGVVSDFNYQGILNSYIWRVKRPLPATKHCPCSLQHSGVCTIIWSAPMMRKG